MADLEAVLLDLRAESDALDVLVAGLDPAGWSRATPAAGWTVAHQIAHLAWTDEQATLAVTDPDAFVAAAQAAAAEGFGLVDAAADAGASAAPADLLARWRSRRGQLADALHSVPPAGRIVWFGPPMSATSMATARLMETWAHGGDVAAALGITRTRTDRVRHVAHLAVRTRGFAYLVHDEPVPTADVLVELLAPSGAVWTWGPGDARQRITGSAWDFALLATQRVHRRDTDLVAIGQDADHWLDIIQAFAGPPGPGRPPHNEDGNAAHAGDRAAPDHASGRAASDDEPAP